MEEWGYNTLLCHHAVHHGCTCVAWERICAVVGRAQQQQEEKNDVKRVLHCVHGQLWPANIAKVLAVAVLICMTCEAHLCTPDLGPQC